MPLHDACRTCPGCGGQFPAPRFPNYRRKNSRPVWTCTKCYKEECKRAGRSSAAYKQRTPGAVVGTGGKRASQETQAKLKALFDREPQMVIHRLCCLLEGNL